MNVFIYLESFKSYLQFQYCYLLVSRFPTLGESANQKSAQDLLVEFNINLIYISKPFKSYQRFSDDVWRRKVNFSQWGLETIISSCNCSIHLAQCWQGCSLKLFECQLHFKGHMWLSIWLEFRLSGTRNYGFWTRKHKTVERTPPKTLKVRSTHRLKYRSSKSAGSFKQGVTARNKPKKKKNNFPYISLYHRSDTSCSNTTSCHSLSCMSQVWSSLVSVFERVPELREEALLAFPLLSASFPYKCANTILPHLNFVNLLVLRTVRIKEIILLLHTWTRFHTRLVFIGTQ